MATLTIVWHEQTSDFGQPMPWFGSWLVGDGETEGDWFHSGRGAAQTSHETPDEAVGVRLRFWPSEGLDPGVHRSAVARIGGVIKTSALDYDHPGPYSRLDLSQL